MWKREYAGRYVNCKTGTIIEKSYNGGWNIINVVTGKVLDNVASLKEAKRIYE